MLDSANKGKLLAVSKGPSPRVLLTFLFKHRIPELVIDIDSSREGKSFIFGHY